MSDRMDGCRQESLVWNNKKETNYYYCFGFWLFTLFTPLLRTDTNKCQLATERWTDASPTKCVCSGHHRRCRTVSHHRRIRSNREPALFALATVAYASSPHSGAHQTAIRAHARWNINSFGNYPVRWCRGTQLTQNAMRQSIRLLNQSPMSQLKCIAMSFRVDWQWSNMQTHIAKWF